MSDETDDEFEKKLKQMEKELLFLTKQDPEKAINALRQMLKGTLAQTLQFFEGTVIPLVEKHGDEQAREELAKYIKMLKEMKLSE